MIRFVFLLLCIGAHAAWAQAPDPAVFSVTAQFDNQWETKRLPLQPEPSTASQHLALLERTHTFDVGGSMPRAQWEARFAAGVPDDTIPLGCDATTCRFMRHRRAKTGVDVTLRPMGGSGGFQTLAIGVALHRFLPSLDAQDPSQVDTWTRDIDTSLRVGDHQIIDLDGHGVLTIERVAAP